MGLGRGGGDMGWRLALWAGDWELGGGWLRWFTVCCTAGESALGGILGLSHLGLARSLVRCYAVSGSTGIPTRLRLL